MEVRIGKDNTFASVLRAAGYKATFGRVALLRALSATTKPVSVEEVVETMKPKLNVVNAYRALEAFVRSGIVRKVDLHHLHAHYELSGAGGHHHHVVCESCGKVEDVHLAEELELEKKALEKSRFGTIRSHALEFFGECTNCAKKKGATK